MNSVNLIGRLARDPEPKQTKDGYTFLGFTLAVRRDFHKPNQDEVDYVNCIAFKQTADFLTNYARKGDMIGIHGRVSVRSYEKDGKIIYNTDIAVDRAELLSKPKEEEPRRERREERSEPSIKIETDELPFY